MAETTATEKDGAALDVFAAALWLDELWNSSARAVAADRIEWQCDTWGSGRGCGDWENWNVFAIVAYALGLPSWRNRERRDELVVEVPLGRFAHVRRIVERLSQDEPSSWPWFDEDVEDDFERRVELAAEVLEVPVPAIAANGDLLDVLRLN